MEAHEKNNVNLVQLLRLKQLGIIAIVAWVCLFLHELAHATAYWVQGYKAWISFQRVHPQDEINSLACTIATMAGPIITWVLAFIGQILVQNKPRSFILSTVGFANASMRIFPTAIALLLAVLGTDKGFSDEGELALTASSTPSIRIILLALYLLFTIGLTVLFGQSYNFHKWPRLKLIAIYLVVLGVGFLAMVVDRICGFS